MAKPVGPFTGKYRCRTLLPAHWLGWKRRTKALNPRIERVVAILAILDPFLVDLAALDW
jgi:hypothetical protein